MQKIRTRPKVITDVKDWYSKDFTDMDQDSEHTFNALPLPVRWRCSPLN